MSSPILAQTAKKELLQLPFLVPSVFITILYLISTVYLLNYRLIFQTVFGSYPTTYKMILLFDLFQGLWTAFSPLGMLLLVINAILVAINIVLVSRSIKRLRDQGAIQISVGGATLIALVTAGCGSCGFSILSILGLSTSISFLPFKGLELHILATIMLIFSFFYMLKQLHEKVYCKNEKIKYKNAK